MPSIVFMNGSTGESKELDLETCTKDESEKAFIETVKGTQKASKKNNNQES